MIPKIASTVAATLGPCFLEETPLGEKPKAARTLLCGRGSRPVPQSLGKLCAVSTQRLFDDGTYSDLTIVCDNHHKVHKAIVCPRSEFFASACNGPFQEGESSVIHLAEDDPFAVKAMLHYLYHLDYPFMAVPVVDADEAAMSQPFTFRCAYQPNEFTQTDPATGPGARRLPRRQRKRRRSQGALNRAHKGLNPCHRLQISAYMPRSMR
ncbi:hypothetical protein AU210_016313 [Fusarium oxysporum f. sp. radicis-cucumerinum]|uniref:BTB domain-containing protein n=1 Tax=Fusarium oxysporum f. sp. radicis-cucumerinum TaxID=327505 RepID=A0A2H3FNU4_FUSOX|nr:hypothetical protein AU210_016313 [Fusarium oxysporum f. sp. radicis-cucumerinum]